MESATFGVTNPHHSCLVARPSHTTHSPPYCEESPYNHHPFFPSWSHYDTLLQVSHRQRSGVLLYRDCCVTKFPSRICHQGSEQKCATYSGGQFPIRWTILRWMVYVLSVIIFYLSNVWAVIFTTAMHGGVELAFRTSFIPWRWYYQLIDISIYSRGECKSSTTRMTQSNDASQLPLIMYPAVRRSITPRKRNVGIRPRTFNYYCVPSPPIAQNGPLIWLFLRLAS